MTRTRNTIIAAGIAAAALALVGCSQTTPTPEESTIGGDIHAPVTVTVNELQGETVEIDMKSFLYIDTESLAVDSYTAEVADPSIVEFVQGSSEGSSTSVPGFEPLAPGETEVTMTNEDGGIQPLTFTIVVVE